jgi:hypothetical protein
VLGLGHYPSVMELLQPRMKREMAAKIVQVRQAALEVAAACPLDPSPCVTTAWPHIKMKERCFHVTMEVCCILLQTLLKSGTQVSSLDKVEMLFR